MATKLERSVGSELLESFGIAVGAMTFITLIAGAYGPVRDGLPLGTVMRLIPLLIPHMLPWTIPTAFIAACIVTYGRMASSNELIAVRASGIHILKILTPAIVLSLVLCGICGLLNHELVPRTLFSQYSLAKSASASEQAAALRTSDPIMSIGAQTVYVGEVSRHDTFRDVVIVVEGKSLERGTAGGEITYIRAPLGRYEYSDERSEIVFYLYGEPSQATPQNPHAGQAMLTRTRPGGPRDFEQAYFSESVFPIKLRSMEDLNFLPNRGRHMTSDQLLLKKSMRDRELNSGEHNAPDTSGMTEGERRHAEKVWARYVAEPFGWSTEFHNRVARSLAPLLLGLIGIPLGVMTQKTRRLAGFGLAIVIVLGGYYPLVLASAAMGASGILPPAVAVWGVTAIIGVLGIIMSGRMLRQ